MTLTQRIRLSRRHGGISQSTLADLVGVHRSAVSHWESVKPKRPNIGHLLAIAVACGVQFEWLATGRGAMLISEQAQLDSVATAKALMVEEEHELELLRDVAVAERQVDNDEGIPHEEAVQRLRNRLKG